MDWDTLPLEACLESLIDYRGKSPTKSSTGIPVLSAKVVKTTGLLRPIEQTIAPDYYPKWMTRGLPQSGDVVMTTEAPMGEVIQLDDETSKFALGQRIVCMRGKTGKLDNTYLRYLLTSPNQQELLASYATGTTVLGISQKALRSVPISFPAIAEQQRIGTLLSALDDKIELNRRMNETLEAQARALFRDWFVDFGPVKAKMANRITANTKQAGTGDAGAAIQAPYLSDEIWSLFPSALDDDGKPEGWDEAPLTDFFNIVGGGTPKTKIADYWGGDIPWFSVTDTPTASDVFVTETEKTITETGLAGSSARLIREGATIITARGTVGKLAMAGREMAFNQSCYALIGRNGIGDTFVYLAARHMIASLQAMSHGSVFSTITRDTFTSIKLAKASDQIWPAFESLANPLFGKIKANVEQSRTLAQTRDLLLPKLMSGKIRVAQAAREIEAVL